MAETRREATERTTAAAAWWLWSARGARSLGLEVGVNYQGHLTTPWHGRWRVDLVGVCRRGRNALRVTGWRVVVVEVKGTKADLAREDTAVFKWTLDIPGCELWVACGDEATGMLATKNVPAHWGVVVFPQGGKRHVVRKPAFDEDLHPGDFRAMDAFRAIAEVNTAQRLPTAVNVLKSRGGDKAVVDRLFADGWSRQWREYAAATGHNDSDVGKQMNLLEEK